MESFKICTVNVEDPEVLAEFLALISVTFKNRDEYKEVKAFDLKPHYHSDYESRLFLEGSAVFTIDGEDIVCSKGTYIEILPEVVHALVIGVVKKLNPKMVKVKNITPTNYKWRSEDGKNKYPSDCVMVEGPLVTMYILKNNENNDKT